MVASKILPGRIGFKNSLSSFLPHASGAPTLIDHGSLTVQTIVYQYGCVASVAAVGETL
jgi:hypothetical protein